MTKHQKTEPVARESASIPEDQLSCLRACFPEAFTEDKVDMEKLRDTLGDIVETSPERYSFTWAGKKDAIRILQTASRATLIPSEKESVNFDTSKNLFIEGDNLEVLKLLYKSYFGQVKMIYLDPPYNTGHDFIYPDNFTDSLDPYLKLTGQKDTSGNLLTSNPETNGRYHSAWLSMMYPRLFIARQLLKEDGVLFCSINDVELPHLRLLLDEIFGDDTFIGTFIWKSRHNVDSRNKSGISSDHEYVVCYGRRILGQAKDREKYSNPDNDPRGDWMSDNMIGLATKDRRPNLHYDLINPATGINYGCPEKGWRYERPTMAKKIAEGRILWPANPDGRPRHKKFWNELQSEFTGFSSILDAPNTSSGTQELRDIFGKEVFDFPKPMELLKLLVKQGSADGDIVLDFFAGSCSTAHAVLQSNIEDSSERRFIMVQLPEPINEGTTARQSGFKSIADIGKERIRRVLKKLKSKDGFQVFKLVGSNYRPWTGTEERDPEALAKQMEAFNDPLVEGWKSENVLYEVAIKEGFGLNIQTEHIESVKGQEVHRVTDPDRERSFYLCLDDKLNIDALAPLKLTQDDLFICRDIALDDTAAANLALQCRLKTI